MGDNPENYPVEQVEDRGTDEAPGGFFQSILDIFIDPVKVFRRIAGGLAWWKAYILLSAAGILAGYLMLPLQRKLVELNPTGLEEEQLERTLEAVNKYGVIGLVAVPVFIIIAYLILSGIAHFAISIMSSSANFKKTLSLNTYCAIVVMLGQIISMVILVTRGPDAIESVEDMKMSFSLAAFFPLVRGGLGALLESLGVFQVWYYVLFGIGASRLFHLNRNKAIAAAVVVWIVSFVFILAQGFLRAGPR